MVRVRFLTAFAVLVVGVVVSFVGDSTTFWFIVGMLLSGFGAVAIVSLFFYEVGLSEDRELKRRSRRE